MRDDALGLRELAPPSCRSRKDEKTSTLRDGAFFFMRPMDGRKRYGAMFEVTISRTCEGKASKVTRQAIISSASD